MIMSSILLSLGAPFWYNLLKTLTNLRPRVAEIIGREKREAEKHDAKEKVEQPSKVST